MWYQHRSGYIPAKYVNPFSGLTSKIDLHTNAPSYVFYGTDCTLEKFLRAIGESTAHENGTNGSCYDSTYNSDSGANGHTKAEGKCDLLRLEIHDSDLTNICERVGLPAEAIVKVAPITPTQGEFPILK